jgi:hypothetical protein
MSFSSLEAGHGSSAGAILYPFRELLRDALEREVRAELAARLPPHDLPSAASPAKPSSESVEWLRTDDSPLLLHNVEEFVLDPEAHLRAIAERMEGTGRAPRPSGAELTGATPRQGAEGLRARLRTVAELDAEKILAAPRRRGTPKGETRTHYVWLVSPDRDISNAEFKRLILEIIRRRWPDAVVAGYIHRDTDNTHLHLWLSAETLSGKKIGVTRLRPSGNAVLDKYPDLDEEVTRAFSRHFNDPSIYDDHITKKLEWVHWRERFEDALRREERSPAMPYRARHDYDWLAERRAVAEREKGENLSHQGEKEKAAPVPRSKSLMGALELWGKTIHLDTRVRDRRELLASFDRGQQRDDRADLERQLAEAERDCERHAEAFKKTLENRARKGYPELKYPLHNTRQLEEMAAAAVRTFDPQLLRHVHAYEILDLPGDDKDLNRVFGEKWGAEIMAEVAAQGEMLHLRAMLPDGRTGRGKETFSSGDATAHEARLCRRMFDEWAAGKWGVADMRRGSALLADEGLRRQAERYVRAREYVEATREVLGGYRRAGGDARRPVLSKEEQSAVERTLASGDDPCDERWRGRMRGALDAARGRGRLGDQERENLLAASLPAPAKVEGVRARAGDSFNESLRASRPFDDHWFARLQDLDTLAGTRALAAAVRTSKEDNLEKARGQARDLRASLEVSAWVRAGAGLAGAPNERAPYKERNEFADLRGYVSQRLLRDPDWTWEQIEMIREFASHSLERDRERLSEALTEAERRLTLAASEREVEEEVRVREKVRALNDALNEGLDRLDGRYVVEAFRTLDLERDGENESVKRWEQELTKRYVETVKGHGLISLECAPTREELRVRARQTVTSVIDLAERMKDALHAALLDDPPARLLDERLGELGMTLRYRQSKSRQVVGADLTYGEVSVDTRSLGKRLDGRTLDEHASHASPPRHSREVEQTVRACMRVCLSDDTERGQISERIRRAGGRLSATQIEELQRLQYALLVRETVRAGAERDWPDVDKKILEMGGGPSESEKQEHLVRVRGVSQLIDREQNAERMRAFLPVREIQGPTRPERGRGERGPEHTRPRGR